MYVEEKARDFPTYYCYGVFHRSFPYIIKRCFKNDPRWRSSYHEKMKVIQCVSAKLVVSKYYSNCSILRYSSSGSISFGFWKGIPEIWDLSKIQRGIRETFTGYGIWVRTFKAGFSQIWSRNGIGKENDIRDSDDRSSGCGIPVRKERDCRIRAPLLERTVFTIVRYTSYNSTLEYIL